jgi:hypothetical protein
MYLGEMECKIGPTLDTNGNCPRCVVTQHPCCCIPHRNCTLYDNAFSPFQTVNNKKFVSSFVTVRTGIVMLSWRAAVADPPRSHFMPIESDLNPREQDTRIARAKCLLCVVTSRMSIIVKEKTEISTSYTRVDAERQQPSAESMI